MSHRIIIYEFKPPSGNTLTASEEAAEGCSGRITYVPPDGATPEQIGAHTRKIAKLADKMNEPDEA